MLWLHLRKKYVELTIRKLFRVCYSLMIKLFFVLWNNDNFTLSISYKSTTKPDKWFMQLLVPTTHTAPSSPVQESFEGKNCNYITISESSKNISQTLHQRLFILKEKYRPWNDGNRRKNFLNPFYWTQVRSWQCISLSFLVSNLLFKLFDTFISVSTGLTIIREREISDEIFGKDHHKILDKSTKIQINI